jgi:hypothetical protein
MPLAPGVMNQNTQGHTGLVGMIRTDRCLEFLVEDDASGIDVELNGVPSARRIIEAESHSSLGRFDSNDTERAIIGRHDDRSRTIAGRAFQNKEFWAQPDRRYNTPLKDMLSHSTAGILKADEPLVQALVQQRRNEDLQLALPRPDATGVRNLPRLITK